MNAKKCKALRRKAREETRGLPLRKLVAKKHEVTIMVEGKTKKVIRLQAINHPETERGVYRAMKKAVR